MPRAKTSSPASARPSGSKIELPKEMPEAFKQLDNIGKTLERHYKDVQDIEFTIQRGKVWMLQTRNAKRTGFAAVRIAVDLVNEGHDHRAGSPAETADSGRRPEPAPAADLRSQGQEEESQARASCWPRASTPARARPRARSASTPPTPRPCMTQGSQGRADPRPPRNQPRRPPRHEDRQGHPHRVRRRQLARGPGQPADGQGLHRRLRRARHRLPQGNGHRRRQDAQAGRLDQHRRLLRRSLRRAKSPPSPAKSSKCSSPRPKSPRNPRPTSGTRSS